jgi:hypothetical protein
VIQDRGIGDAARVDERLRKLAQEWAERTAVEQGLPPKVTDPAVLRRVAQILRPDKGPERLK